ncbi:cytochrome c oxidase subunit IVB [Bacillus fonticola]|uniref:cytochrome c oxidase subunit IVB n=1 Tax=Bacillus fonticola TaxID=2728853 RepID=UPI0014763BCE|nr:cytochrome c oxidase subunit IVB [Bacillus fonticola]
MEQHNTGNPRVDVAYRKKKNKEDMKFQLVTFVMMLALTFVAFAAVEFEMAGGFVAPFILLLAVVQVIFQLYYFMHMSHKGHETVTLFLYSGVLVAFLTILTFLTIVNL